MRTPARQTVDKEQRENFECTTVTTSQRGGGKSPVYDRQADRQTNQSALSIYERQSDGVDGAGAAKGVCIFRSSVRRVIKVS